jgi:hypothetical protein
MWAFERISGYALKQYPNGDIYAGQWLDGRRHGFGTLTETSGKKYIGPWADGTKHGDGFEIREDGTKVAVTFHHDWLCVEIKCMCRVACSKRWCSVADGDVRFIAYYNVFRKVR